MSYDDRSSGERASRELELLQNTLSEVDASYTWRQVKELLQERVFPRCEKFGTWSSGERRVDRVPNRKVSTQKDNKRTRGEHMAPSIPHTKQLRRGIFGLTDMQIRV